MISLFENNLLKFYYDYIDFNLENNINFEYCTNFTLMQIDNIWSEFYSNFVKERGNNNIIFNYSKDYFVDFILKFENDWPNYVKEIYGVNYQKKIEADITKIIIQNLIKTFIQNKNNLDPINDYYNFKDSILKIKFSDVFK